MMLALLHDGISKFVFPFVVPRVTFTSTYLASLLFYFVKYVVHSVPSKY